MSKGKKIGYVRVSAIDQNPGRQLDGIRLDKVFTDHASGKDKNRPQLEALLNFVREDDTVIVHSMDRLARNLDDLRQIVRELTSQKIKIQFIKESLTFAGDDSPLSNLLLSVMGAFAEFERALIKERQREGIALAKKKGLFTGRKLSLTQEQIKEAITRWNKREKITTIAKDLGVVRQTIYRYFEREGITWPK